MIRRFLDWLLRQGIGARAIGSIHRSNRRLDKLERQRIRMIGCAKDRLKRLDKIRQQFNTEIDDHVEKIEKIRQQLNTEVDSHVESVKEMEILVKRYDQELEALRDRIDIFENGVLPTLIAANRQYREMWEAEAAVHARRKMAPSPGEGLGNVHE